jgi:ubiquitin
MQIFIKTLTGKIISLRVDSSDTIGDVKLQILNKEGIAPNEQRLVLNRKELDDHHTIAYYDIQENSVIHFSLNVRVVPTLQIFIRNTDGKIFPLKAESSDTIYIKFEGNDSGQRKNPSGPATSDRSLLVGY